MGRSSGFCLLFVLVFSGLGNCYGMCPRPQRDALLRFKTAWLPNPGGNFGSWNQYNTPDCCDWIGIVCVSGIITEFSIGGSGDTLPDPARPGQWESALAEIIRLAPAVEKVYIANFKLGKFPKVLTNMTKLKHLTLYDADLGTELPPEIGNWLNMEFFSIRGPQCSEPSCFRPILLPGSISDGICSWSRLQSLFIESQALTGRIPGCINKLQTVKEIWLDHNQLTGPLPWSLGYLPNLVELHLEYNNITGIIPGSFNNLDKLEILFLTDNRLVGPLPKELGGLAQLRELRLARNRIYSTIPPEISQLARIRVVDLSENYLYGEIPQDLGNFSNTSFHEQLFLQKNYLSGSIPPNLIRFCNKAVEFVCVIDLSYNRLSGSLPSDFLSASASGVVTFSTGRVDILIHHNRLSGLLPMYKGTHLYLLNASHNQFTGGFQLSFANVIAVDLSYNKLNSLAPTGAFRSDYNLTRYTWSQYPNINSELRLSHNQLKGYFPAWLTRMMGTSTKILDISHNAFQGQLPHSVFNAPNLDTLDVSHNYFYSTLPPNPFQRNQQSSFGVMTIDLHHNSFYGEVPAGFIAPTAELPEGEEALMTWPPTSNVPKYTVGYRYMDISENRLWGSLPDRFGTGRTVLDQYHLDLSDNFFVGILPWSIGKIELLRFLDLSNNDFTGKIPISYANLKFLEILDTSGNNLSS